MAMTETKPDYGRIRSVKQIPLEEFYTSGHRTCQGCESATVMRGFIKAAGPRTIATGSTGCMYVANTSYMTTPWIIPWMHTQLGAGGSSAILPFRRSARTAAAVPIAEEPPAPSCVCIQGMIQGVVM